MNWEALGAAAELIAAVGGVAAVVYLAVQIRLNTKAVRSAAIDSWVAAIAHGNEAMSAADEFIPKTLSDYDELDDRQRRIFHRALTQMFNAMEALFFHHMNGVVDDHFLDAKIRVAKFSLQEPVVRHWWSTRGNKLFDSRFTQYVEGLLSDFK